jgi:serine/threonine-protein kinase
MLWQAGVGHDIAAPATDLFEWLIVSWRGLLMLTITGVAAVFLWRLPPRAMRGLRMIELGLLSPIVVMMLAVSVDPQVYGILEKGIDQPDWIRNALVGHYALAGSLIWFVTLIMYGVLIPNTWRRTLAVCGVVGLSPLVLFTLYGLWVRPLDFGIYTNVLSAIAFYIGLAVAIVVFASSRIEVLRCQAAEARKLGQYVLKEKLGAGGMGEVFRAEHVLLRRPCALKIIRPERAGDPKNLRRFEREVRVTATLTHPNTVQIFDYGHAADGTFYYVMEYLPGMTLEELVRHRGPLPPARAIHFLRQICGALKEAHGRGLIHRDIKPSNVMICERGGVHDVAKLLDFGLVLPPLGESDGEKLTQEGSVTGTPAYLSPEQAGLQDTLDARSDIYSIGALAYFLLAGQPPFANRSSVKMLAAHLYEEPEPLSLRRPDVPADVEAIVLRCLAKDPNARFPDAESLALSLAACRASAWTESDASHEWRASS